MKNKKPGTQSSLSYDELVDNYGDRYGFAMDALCEFDDDLLMELDMMEFNEEF